MIEYTCLICIIYILSVQTIKIPFPICFYFLSVFHSFINCIYIIICLISLDARKAIMHSIFWIEFCFMLFTHNIVKDQIIDYTLNHTTSIHPSLKRRKKASRLAMKHTEVKTVTKLASKMHLTPMGICCKFSLKVTMHTQEKNKQKKHTQKNSKPNKQWLPFFLRHAQKLNITIQTTTLNKRTMNVS